MEAIRLLVSDVDGVMNQGILYFGLEGEEVMKAFHVKDGMGIRLWLQEGRGFAVLSGRGSPILRQRLGALGVTDLHENVSDKLRELQDMLLQKKLHPDQVAYIGDDLNDVELMQWLRTEGGVTFAPSDAVSEVQGIAGTVLKLKGGEGALRECIDTLRFHNRS